MRAWRKRRTRKPAPALGTAPKAPAPLVDGVARPSERNARTRRLEGDELPRLLAVCPPHMGLLVRFALETAARLGELLALRWEDVNIARRVAVLHGIDWQLDG